ncbi:MAG: tRNA (adenosine(37)-N6)-threonylcarbamoyltransferase complex ATPase subunit type 1 TsaE [Patescibacteria group bacterium]
MEQYTSSSLENTKAFANELALSLQPNEKGAIVVGLYGELGAGKTTFMKYLAEILGVKETIQSPTFVIMRRYKTSPPSLRVAPLLGKERGWGEVLVHIDAYRLDSGTDLLKLGWKDLIKEPKNLICIEWPERVTEIMPPHIMLRFEHGEREDQRKISIA